MDMFGYTPQLNINKEGDQYKTMVGGYISIMIIIGMGIYIYVIALKFLDEDTD